MNYQFEYDYPNPQFDISILIKNVAKKSPDKKSSDLILLFG